MHFSPSLITFIVGLVAVMNPLGNTAIYIAMTGQHERQHQKKVAFVASVAIAVILVLVTWIGDPLLGVFGISVDAFRVAGGLIVLLIALRMSRGHSLSQPVPQGLGKKGQDQFQHPRENIAVVPLAIPLFAGPGAISTIIAHMPEFNTVEQRFFVSLICICIAAGIWVLLYFGPFIGRILGEYGMKIVIRVMGLILAAIAIQMFAAGLLGLLPGLGG